VVLDHFLVVPINQYSILMVMGDLNRCLEDHTGCCLEWTLPQVLKQGYESENRRPQRNGSHHPIQVFLRISMLIADALDDKL